MLFFYGILPFAGAFFNRYRWERFRRRFDELRLSPLIDYRQYRQMGEESGIKGGVFRFTGGVESITDGHTLWVRGDDLTIPVSLEKTQCWLLPKHEGEGVPDAPEQIRWNRISTLNEGAKVFIGGVIKTRNDRLSFTAEKDKPLMVIFYDCPDAKLADTLIRAARNRNEYWNNITPASIAFGVIALIYIAASFLDRPAFRLTVISAMLALFIPVLPIFPPGLLLTVVYRRMTWHARKLRAYWDLARLPLRYLPPGCESSLLCTGERYGYVKLDSLPPEISKENAPFLIQGLAQDSVKDKIYFYGVLEENNNLPVRSKDPFVSFGLLPANPAALARFYAVKAYSLEAFAWLIQLLGITANIIFIYMLLFAR